MKQTAYDHSFLSGGGEMGQRIREYDWDSSSLGNPSTWSQALKTALRLMLSSGHPMFIWWGPDLIQFYNDPYRPSIGHDRHPSALGQPGHLCWPEIWSTISPGIQRVINGEGSIWMENHLVPISRNGRIEDAYWTYSYDPIYDDTAPNKVGGILVILNETTHWVKEKQRHHEQEQLWRDLFTNAPAFMCVHRGPEYVYEYANTRYCELIGRQDFLNKPLRDVLPEIYEQGFGDLLDHIYATGEIHIGHATPITFKDSAGGNRQLYVDFVLQPIRNAADEITGIFANGYDVTERIRLQHSLEEQDKRKDEFLAMLAHELRNPLAPIRNASELLIQTTAQESMPYSLGELVKRQVDQLTRLLDDLLEVSRISQGRLQLKMAPVVLDEAIKFAIESTSIGLVEKHIRLYYECDQKGIVVNGDFARIAQCLINIIVNATKYSDKDGKVTVRLTRDHSAAVVEISDSGVGIAPDMLGKIFDMFVQVDATIDRSQGGLGIGLSVVKKLVEMHGGSITAQSAGLGKGATFVIRLPALPVGNTREAPKKPAALTPMKFLLVDDNEDAANSLAMLLNILGHQTRVVYRGEDALKMLNEESVDLMLLDIGLPDIDGYKVAETIRRTNTQLPIIALSGYGQAEDIRRALDAGFSAHLTKPISLDALEKKIATVIGECSNGLA